MTSSKRTRFRRSLKWTGVLASMLLLLGLIANRRRSIFYNGLNYGISRAEDSISYWRLSGPEKEVIALMTAFGPRRVGWRVGRPRKSDTWLPLPTIMSPIARHDCQGNVWS